MQDTDDSDANEHYIGTSSNIDAEEIATPQTEEVAPGTSDREEQTLVGSFKTSFYD